MEIAQDCVQWLGFSIGDWAFGFCCDIVITINCDSESPYMWEHFVVG